MSNTINKQDLKVKLENAESIAIIDVRSKDEFDQMHIEQAIHIPLEELKNIARFLNCNSLYVTVCGKGGGRSEEGARIIEELGLKSAALVGGTFGWLDNTL
jgi:rhodanese-related sulfurtransferase